MNYMLASDEFGNFKIYQLRMMNSISQDEKSFSIAFFTVQAPTGILRYDLNE